MDKDLKIEPVNDEVFDLETLIVEGTDAYVPLKFVYPNTDKTVGVFVKPITTTEFMNMTQTEGNMFIKTLRVTLFNRDKEPFKEELLQQLPAGVVMELYRKVAEISGIQLEENKQTTQEILDRLMGF